MTQFENMTGHTIENNALVEDEAITTAADSSMREDIGEPVVGNSRADNSRADNSIPTAFEKTVKNPKKRAPKSSSKPLEFHDLNKKIDGLAKKFTKAVQSIGEKAGILLDVTILVQPKEVPSETTTTLANEKASEEDVLEDGNARKVGG